MESKKTDTAQEAELLAVEAAGADAGEDSTEDTEEGLVLKLRKPFVFDGQTYTQAVSYTHLTLPTMSCV